VDETRLEKVGKDCADTFVKTVRRGQRRRSTGYSKGRRGNNDREGEHDGTEIGLPDFHGDLARIRRKTVGKGNYSKMGETKGELKGTPKRRGTGMSKEKSGDSRPAQQEQEGTWWSQTVQKGASKNRGLLGGNRYESPVRTTVTSEEKSLHGRK